MQRGYMKFKKVLLFVIGLCSSNTFFAMKRFGTKAGAKQVSSAFSAAKITQPKTMSTDSLQSFHQFHQKATLAPSQHIPFTKNIPPITTTTLSPEQLQNLLNNDLKNLEIYQTFQQWIKKQSSDIQNHLKPLINKYNNSFQIYLNTLKEEEGTSMLPYYNTDIILPIMNDPELLSKYIDYLKSIQKFSYENSEKIISDFIRKKKQEEKIKQERLDRYKKVAPGFNPAIYEHGTLQEIENFHGTIFKPESLALRHIEQRFAPSEDFSPLCSQNINTTAAAFYDRLKRVIQLNKHWHESPPAFQLQTLRHELQHRIQDNQQFLTYLDDPQKAILDKIKNYLPQKIINDFKDTFKKNDFNITDFEQLTWLMERDADYNGTSHIKCPTCLKVCQASRHEYSTIVQKMGYYGIENYEPHIQLAHTLKNPICPAHTLTPVDDDHNEVVQKLEQAIKKYRQNHTQELANEIQELDKQSGGLLDHIPGFNKDLINALQHHRELQAKMAQAVLDVLKAQQTSACPEELKLLAPSSAVKPTSSALQDGMKAIQSEGSKIPSIPKISQATKEQMQKHEQLLRHAHDVNLSRQTLPEVMD